ncbi:MAG: hypothetical protein JXE06_09080 [Coriobacteriia bacterium]|nr:hypothetical protein [Coriobacteriia bacterium]MBN2823119.1 hypothetical protein [Coriobacteriia bacterium]
MIISDEQVRLAVEYLQTQDVYAATEIVRRPDEATALILRRVVDTLCQLPDVRVDRVAEARELLAGPMPSTQVVADKLIGRILSDSIR